MTDTTSKTSIKKAYTVIGITWITLSVQRKKGQYIGMVCIWGSPVNRGEMTVEQAKEYIAEEQFAKGSMLPKIEAAIRFAESGEGRRTLITLLDKAAEGIAGKTGTVIHQ